jgi:hypothetical protein
MVVSLITYANGSEVGFRLAYFTVLKCSFGPLPSLFSEA